MNLTNLIKTNVNQLAKFGEKHAPEILTGMGVAGMISTTVLAIKATPKACKLIEDAKSVEKTDKLTVVQTVKACWKEYIPTACSLGASIACVIGAAHINYRRNAAITAAAMLSDTALKEYKAKVAEMLPEKTVSEIKDGVSEDHLAKNPVDENNIFETKHGNTLCYDPYSGRYFKANMEYIRRIINDANYWLNQNGRVSLNDIYELIGLDTTAVGDDLSWGVERGLIELNAGTHLASNGEPCIVVDYLYGPTFYSDIYD